MTARLVLFLFFLIISQNAEASRFSGGYLLKVCEIGENNREEIPGGHAVCQSYIAGVIDSNNVMRSLALDGPSIDFCIPQTVSLNELHRVVLEYLRNNVQHDAFVASPAVATALMQAYPCG